MNLILSPSFFVQPVHGLMEAVALAHFDRIDPFITEGTVELRPNGEGKQVYVACFGSVVDIQTAVGIMGGRGKCLCRDAPMYLANLLAEVSEEMMPAIIADIHIVAANPENRSSIFSDSYGNRCFLAASRWNGKRGLFLVNAARRWPPAYGFLVEDA